MTSEPPLLASFEAGIARLTLNRPEKRNALTRDLIQQMISQLSEFQLRPELRLLVLEAQGPAFCAGMDLTQMQQRASQPDASQAYLEDSVVYGELLKLIFHLSVPTLAVVQGPALAGGMGIVLASDLVIAADSAFFALPEPMRDHGRDRHAVADSTFGIRAGEHAAAVRPPNRSGPGPCLGTVSPNCAGRRLGGDSRRMGPVGFDRIGCGAANHETASTPLRGQRGR